MQPGDFPIAGVGIDELLAKGALVGVCNIALTLNAGMIAKKLGTDAAAVKQEWVASLFPGVQVVPSGVIAVNRAQEKGCAYCFAG
jgi:intracellular sulfur oxidation DsrE/DsrF family protein